MENDDMGLFGEMTFKKESAYLTMLKKRGRYLIKHLRKVQSDFLKKYQNKASSQKQFLQDVKLMFNIYEVLVSEIISDLEFTQLQAFGEGVQKLFQQIVMIVSYLIQSFFINSNQDQHVRKPVISSPRVAQFNIDHQATLETAQETRKRLYQISEKTFYNLKEESRLYDILASGDDELHRIQDQVLKNKGTVEAIKESQLQSNLKQAFEYLSQYSAYSRNFLDKAQKRLKQLSTDLVALEVTKQNFFQQQTITKEKKQRKARSTCVLINQIKKFLRNDVATQTEANHFHPSNVRRSTNSGMVQLRSLQKKHTEATDKMKEQIKDLTNELAELKARNQEEVQWKERYCEELLQERDKIDKLNDTISQYKECVKYRDNTIKKIKEDNQDLQKKITKLKQEINQATKTSKVSPEKEMPYRQIKNSAHPKTDKHIKFAAENNTPRSKMQEQSKYNVDSDDNFKLSDQFPSALPSQRRIRSRKTINRMSYNLEDHIDQEIMTERVQLVNVHTQTVEKQVQKKLKSAVKFHQIKKSDSPQSSKQKHKSKPGTGKKLAVIEEQSNHNSQITSIINLSSSVVLSSQKSLDKSFKSSKSRIVKSTKQISKSKRSSINTDFVNKTCSHRQNLLKINPQLREILQKILTYIETQSIQNLLSALKLLPEHTHNSETEERQSIRFSKDENDQRLEKLLVKSPNDSKRSSLINSRLGVQICRTEPCQPMTAEMGTQFSTPQIPEALEELKPIEGSMRPVDNKSELKTQKSQQNLSVFPNTLIRVHTVNSKVPLRQKSCNSTAVNLMKQARHSSPGHVAFPAATVPYDSPGSWVNLMPTDNNIPYYGIIKRAKPQTGKTRRTTIKTVDKAKIIGELYKKMLHWRLLNIEKFNQLASVLRLPQSSPKVGLGYEGFSIFASKYIDQHSECIGKPPCSHIIALLDENSPP